MAGYHWLSPRYSAKEQEQDEDEDEEALPTLPTLVTYSRCHIPHTASQSNHLTPVTSNSSTVYFHHIFLTTTPAP